MAREPNQLILPQGMVRTQKAVILSVALPREEEALSLRASSDIGRMKTVRKRENETGRTSRTESEAAVAAMQAKPTEERHATANAELGPRPNYDMGAVANGAPPQTTIWGLPTHIWTSGSAIDAYHRMPQSIIAMPYWCWAGRRARSSSVCKS